MKKRLYQLFKIVYCYLIDNKSLLLNSMIRFQYSLVELNYDQYLIPTSKDIDEIKPFFIEGKEKHGPWGAKSLGEPTLELTAAAIANAIFNATEVRYRNLPINLEEIILLRKLKPANFKRGSA